MGVFQIPEVLVAGIAMFLLSYSSNFFYFMANQRLRMKRSLAGFIARSLGWAYTFNLEHPADKKEGVQPDSSVTESTILRRSSLPKRVARTSTPGITPEMLCRDLNEVLHSGYQPEDPFIRMLVKELQKHQHDEHKFSFPVHDQEDKIPASGLSGAAIADDVFSIREYEK